MVRYHTGTTNDCQSHIRYLLELSGPRLNRNSEPPQHFALVNNSEKKTKNFIRLQGPVQGTALDQNVYGVWFHIPQSKQKSLIPDATTNKHIPYAKETNGMFISIIIC